MSAANDPDQRYMAAALRLAARGLGRAWPNPAVGCLLVKGEGDATRIVAGGWTQAGGRPHAERMALDAAGAGARGATAYVTLEPCAHTGRTPPCAQGLIEAGVARVVAAMADPDETAAGGLAALAAAGIAIRAGVLESEARWLALGHVLRVTQARPFVQLKLAVSRDGMIAGAGGRPVQITGAVANGWVHAMRARADAILVGVGTVLADDPQLTCRLPGAHDRSPVRVILDSGLRTPPDAALFKDVPAVPVWIAAGVDAPLERMAALRAAGADILPLAGGRGGGIDLPALLGALAGRGITRLMVEGGARVAHAFLGADLCDECVLIEGPGDIGADGIALFAAPPVQAMAAMPAMALALERRLGDDRARIYRKEH